MNRWRRIAAVALLGLAVVIAEAGELDRSGLALAYPVDGIQIDGDLSDWPQSLPWYSLPFRLLGPPVDPADCSARFRVGYSEEEDTLYVAVEVHDEERSPSEPLPLAFWPDDLAIVLVGIETSPHQRQSVGFLQGESRANTVTVRGDVNWLEIPPVHFVAAQAARSNGWHYEFRIDVGSMTRGSAHLCPGGVMELNILVHDVDHQAAPEAGPQSKTLGWVVGNPLQRDAGRGDLLLLRREEPVGRLSGTVRLRDGESPRAPKRVRIESADRSGWVAHALTDHDGDFAVQLPAGRYHLAVDQRDPASPSPPTVTISNQAEAVISLTAPQPAGQRLAAVPTMRPAGRGRRQGAWRSYSVADGLPGANITAIVFDQRGELWLGTDGGGLIRFDGARFSTYRLEEILGANVVGHVAEDLDGRLWFSSKESPPGEGVACLDETRTEFIAYSRADGLQNLRFNDLIVDGEGRVCITDGAGLTRLDRKREQFVHFSVESELPDALVQTLATRRKGGLFVGSWFGHQIARWEGDSFSPFDLPIKVQRVYHMLDTRSGDLWAAVTSYYEDGFTPRLYRTRDEGRIWTEFTRAEGYAGQNINCLFEDHLGQIWVGTLDGLLRLEGGVFVNYGAATRLENESVQAIQEDREGRLWIAADGGVLRVHDPAWQTYTEADGLTDNGVGRLVEWGTCLAVGSSGGLTWMEEGRLSREPTLKGEWSTRMLVDQQDRLLVVTNKGTVLWLDPVTRQISQTRSFELGVHE